MRKMLNKKGFSLVELMIVVVIMGILIAVAIPLYGAIQDKAKNNTCKSNVDVIKSNAANYYAMHGVKITNENLSVLKTMFDDNKLPSCPWDNDTEDETDYTVAASATVEGAVTVTCANVATDGHWTAA